MPLEGFRPPVTIATDRLAFRATFRDPKCLRSAPFPEPDMYWGLAATRNAFHQFHIDTDGFGTGITPQTGSKWWVVAREKQGAPGALSRTGLYLEGNYEIDSINSDLWDVEAVLLTPGVCL